MSSRADVIVARARACIGVRFKAQGRGRDGLDCVGLAAVSLGIGRARADYSIRGGSSTTLAEELRAAGLRAVDQLAAGDMLVMRAGPGQLHLGIWTGATLIHADARFRRVVEWPGTAPWPVVGIWRLCSDAHSDRV